MKKLVLGSNSPRRAQLLKELGFTFVQRSADIDETIPDNIKLENAAEYLAVAKNKAITVAPNEVLLTADTIVAWNNESLAKPENDAEAAHMLQKLSGGSHEVITGVCITSVETTCTFSSTTRVIFNDISSWEIDHYIQRFRPFDKAGAYGIQEWIGLAFISRLEGSYHTVVGLPTDLVYDKLVNIFGIRPFQNETL